MGSVIPNSNNVGERFKCDLLTMLVEKSSLLRETRGLHLRQRVLYAYGGVYRVPDEVDLVDEYSDLHLLFHCSKQVWKDQWGENRD
mmetsp:Transcript_7712/g.4551  ORF Transcript_7712/g.4551 Transcript_7712/m.4551 type:complete len:86 (+) Transcript_7712:78-335(+)